MTDRRLAELAEAIAGRLLAGEAIDAEAELAPHPDHAATIRELLPTMNELADLGRSLARGRRHGPSSAPPQPSTERDPSP